MHLCTAPASVKLTFPESALRLVHLHTAFVETAASTEGGSSIYFVSGTFSLEALSPYQSYTTQLSSLPMSLNTELPSLSKIGSRAAKQTPENN